MENFNRSTAQQQRCIENQTGNVDSNHFFNLLTGPQLLDLLETQLPEHRERQYPPTVTLAMFLGQVISADGSCQNAVNEANVSRVLNGLSPNSTSTGAYCTARQLTTGARRRCMAGAILYQGYYRCVPCAL